MMKRLLKESKSLENRRRTIKLMKRVDPFFDNEIQAMVLDKFKDNDKGIYAHSSSDSSKSSF